MMRMSPATGLLLITSCFTGPEPFTLAPSDLNTYRGPTVLATDPPVGSYGVPTDYPLTITLSEAMQNESLLTSLSLHGASGIHFPFSPTWNADGRTLTIRAAWPPNDVVTLHLGTSLLSRQGQGLRDQNPFDGEPDTPFALAFTTGTGMLADAPLLLATDPENGASAISPHVNMTAEFSKRMQTAVQVNVTGPGGELPVAAHWDRGGTRLILTPPDPLHFGTAYRFEVLAATDRWNLPLAKTGTGTSFSTQAQEGHVVINEVVTDPQQDWNDSTGGDSLLFNPVPGSGSITSSDEYIELFNGGSANLDLTGWTLEQLDGSDQIHAFGGAASATERFSSATSSMGRFEPGTYLVVGNPVGENLDAVTIVLKDGTGLERDRVQLGAAQAPLGAASSVTDEAVARVPNGLDTGSDANDWKHVPATPGAPN